MGLLSSISLTRTSFSTILLLLLPFCYSHVNVIVLLDAKISFSFIIRIWLRFIWVIGGRDGCFTGDELNSGGWNSIKYLMLSYWLQGGGCLFPLCKKCYCLFDSSSVFADWAQITLWCRMKFFLPIKMFSRITSSYHRKKRKEFQDFELKHYIMFISSAKNIYCFLNIGQNP